LLILEHREPPARPVSAHHSVFSGNIAREEIVWVLLFVLLR
jgi:hypothetical protein